MHQVEGVQLRHWAVSLKMECRIPSSNISIESPELSNILVCVSGLDATEIGMLARGNLAAADVKETRLEIRGQAAQATIRAFNAICVVPILRHVAQGGLRYDVRPNTPWTPLLSARVPFGTCTITVPPRPQEAWFYDDKRSTWARASAPGVSRKYYLALQAAPRPFEIWASRKEGRLTIKYFPEVVAHQAAGQLIGGRGLGEENNVRTGYRIMDLMQQDDPVMAPFRVSNCDNEALTDVALRGTHTLYERQQKVVTKMVAIEKGNAKFEELEMSELEMPGSARLSLIARATRTTKMRGGVIADAIGAGKTGKFLRFFPAFTLSIDSNLCMSQSTTCSCEHCYYFTGTW
jgi:hypothetical protein